MTGIPEPLEKEEQAAFVQWLDLQGLKYTSIPNSTFTKSFKQKMHNKHQGLRAGFPDMIVVIPECRSIDGVGRLLCIEMKRRKSGVVSPEQKSWIAALDEIGGNVSVQVCNGCDKAIEHVEKYLKSSKITF